VKERLIKLKYCSDKTTVFHKRKIKKFIVQLLLDGVRVLNLLILHKKKFNTPLKTRGKKEKEKEQKGINCQRNLVHCVKESMIKVI